MAALSDLAVKAHEAFIDDHFDLAVYYYTQAIALDPTRSHLFSDRSQANIKLNNFAEAVADASKAIEIDSSNVKAYLHKGTACFSLEEYRTAKAAFKSGSKLAPEDSRFKDWIKKCDTAIAGYQRPTYSSSRPTKDRDKLEVLLKKPQTKPRFPPLSANKPPMSFSSKKHMNPGVHNILTKKQTKPPFSIFKTMKGVGVHSTTKKEPRPPSTLKKRKLFGGLEQSRNESSSVKDFRDVSYQEKLSSKEALFSSGAVEVSANVTQPLDEEKLSSKEALFSSGAVEVSANVTQPLDEEGDLYLKALIARRPPRPNFDELMKRIRPARTIDPVMEMRKVLCGGEPKPHQIPTDEELSQEKLSSKEALFSSGAVEVLANVTQPLDEERDLYLKALIARRPPRPNFDELIKRIRPARTIDPVMEMRKVLCGGEPKPHQIPTDEELSQTERDGDLMK